MGITKFQEIAKLAGAVYKINEGTGGTVLISLDIFDDYMDQFRENPVPMKIHYGKKAKRKKEAGWNIRTKVIHRQRM